MDGQGSMARSKTSQSRGVDTLLAVLSVVAGVFVLWVTWYYYRDVFNVSAIDWLGLLQPGLMITGGVMGLVAAGLLLLGHPARHAVLKTAISIFPFILALRLFVLILRLLGFIASWVVNNPGGLVDGTAFDDVRLSPFNIANIVVLVALAVYLVVRKFTQRTEAPGTRNDTR